MNQLIHIMSSGIASFVQILILQLNDFYWGKLKHNIGNELPLLTYRVLYVLYLYTESTR